MDLSTLQWLAGVAGIVFLGFLIGKIVYIVGGFIVDLLDDTIEHGDE